MKRRPNEIRHKEGDDTAVIVLTQGQVAIIDSADIPLVSTVRWWAQWVPSTNSFYATGKPRLDDGTYRIMQMQRFLLGNPPGMQVDHRNRLTLDNRRSNLRVATRAEQKRNSRTYSSNTSGFVGVYFKKRDSVWHASIAVDGRNQYIGTFATAEEAALARDKRAREIYGNFARLNFPDR